MSNTFKVTIVPQGKDPMEFEAEALITSSADGQVEFKANHSPIIISTIPTTTTIIKDGNKEKLFTSFGIVYIKNNELKFCCDAAEVNSDIDRERALKSKERAEKRIKEKDNIDIDRAKRALARANARVNTISMND